MKKYILVILILSFFGAVLYENTYDMKEKEITISTTKGNLGGFLAKANVKEQGVVIFVHGDGAQNATQDGGYKPLMERFAKQGFSSISWSKPGVDESEGNWLNQSMDDRTNEVLEVVSWIRKRNDLNTEKIILWGASQAGWVIPKVLMKSKEIDGVVLAGPAINWLRQGRYNSLKQMEAEGKSKTEISNRLQFEARGNQYILNGATYEEYQKLFPDSSLTKERYVFIKKNILEDTEKELKEVKVPIYLILAEKDRNVDSQETREVYQKLIAKEILDVQIVPNVGHSMINPTIQTSETLVALSLVLFPKDLLMSNKYLDSSEKAIANFRELPK